MPIIRRIRALLVARAKVKLHDYPQVREQVGPKPTSYFRYTFANHIIFNTLRAQHLQQSAIILSSSNSVLYGP